jgi:hypothetical protein
MSLLEQWEQAVKFIDEVDTVVLHAPPNPRMKLVPTLWKGLRDVYQLHLHDQPVKDDVKAILKKWCTHHKLGSVAINEQLTEAEAERFVTEIVESSQQNNL